MAGLEDLGVGPGAGGRFCLAVPSLTAGRLYGAVLAALGALWVRESGGRVRDNVCGALARLVLAQPQAVPLAQVSPRAAEGPGAVGGAGVGIEGALGGAVVAGH